MLIEGTLTIKVDNDGVDTNSCELVVANGTTLILAYQLLEEARKALTTSIKLYASQVDDFKEDDLLTVTFNDMWAKKNEVERGK